MSMRRARNRCAIGPLAGLNPAGYAAPQVFPKYFGRAPGLYWNSLSLTTARHIGVLHCETEPLHDKRCTAS
ncbi:hypothetical protein R69888_05425 [Paraburkholderia haematera]|uniref:Uncharacterized protein n=1 Tax=Paraburkholderia haematera TaxID=2793077 RepID=A0ABN7MJC8_9BURK|nr:hypothetical protein R69888_05425 [Paraburkholderia haematera]